MKRLRAFTLLELLVVVVVMAVLASLLLPALVRARARVQAIACVSNLKQWSLATLLYVGDHDDWLPPEGTPNPGESATNSGWYVQLPLELGLPRYHDQPWRTNPAVNPGRSVWICPANPRRSNGRNLFHYCLNEHINGTGTGNLPVRLGNLPSPTTLVWLFDTRNLPAVGYWNYVPTNRHANGAQFAFLDGHVLRLGAREYWDFAVDDGRIDNPLVRWIP